MFHFVIIWCSTNFAKWMFLVFCFSFKNSVVIFFSLFYCLLRLFLSIFVFFFIVVAFDVAVVVVVVVVIGKKNISDFIASLRFAVMIKMWMKVMMLRRLMMTTIMMRAMVMSTDYDRYCCGIVTLILIVSPLVRYWFVWKILLSDYVWIYLLMMLLNFHRMTLWLVYSIPGPDYSISSRTYSAFAPANLFLMPFYSAAHECRNALFPHAAKNRQKKHIKNQKLILIWKKNMWSILILV